MAKKTVVPTITKDLKRNVASGLQSRTRRPALPTVLTVQWEVSTKQRSHLRPRQRRHYQALLVHHHHRQER